MIKVGITGQSGFIGYHLSNSIKFIYKNLKLVEFEKNFFNDEAKLCSFVKKCDIIVHLAAKNRCKSGKKLYEINIDLVKKLVSALIKTNSKPHIIFSSSSQESLGNYYGESKKDGTKIFEEWSLNYFGKFTNLIIPNVFGPFGKPNYNSVVSTFCHNLINKRPSKIIIDNKVDFIFINDLIKEIIEIINNKNTNKGIVKIPKNFTLKISSLLDKLKKLHYSYYKLSMIPNITDSNELNLFITLFSYINHEKYFPKLYTLNNDNRGSFVELVRLSSGGQISYSTTLSKIMRGNHFHTRKIERFSVIKGNAKINLRKIGTNKLITFYLDGSKPSYIDIPIWHTHNIQNIGKEELVTIFWINEIYNNEDSDTFIEEV